MAAYLSIVSGVPSQVVVLDEPGSYLAGRAPDCALILVHVEVSRHHCRFDWDGTSCTVEDLGSRRGTFWNGAPLASKSQLHDRDRIAIGPITLEFGLGEPPEEAKGQSPPPASAGMPIFVHGKVSDQIAPCAAAELIIGRDPQCDAVLNHAGVSRKHASLRMLPNGGCAITDLQSTAGSFVNGHRFDSHELTVGDRLQIGPFDFQFDGQALVRIAAARGSAIRATGLTQGNANRLLLNDLTFTISSSRFTGILGPSGAGKSTLLHTLAGLHAPVRGQVLVDGEDVYAKNAVHAFGLVPQEDIVHRELTVAEALRFSARLRLPAATPGIEIQKLILQTMDELGLRDYAAQPILRLSGGQRKRVSVAVELLARPAVLFLDEPSSGLDPATESQLMEVLRELTNTGCTVVCTTHVMENAYLMDELIVITGGCLAFLGTSQEAREYFGVARLHALYERLVERPALEWKEEFAAKRPGLAVPEPPVPKSEWTPKRRAFSLPILLARQWAILASDWRNFLILGVQPLIIAGLVSWATADQSLALFFAYVATLWFGCSNAAQAIVKEIPIYRRERLVGVSTQAYLASKFLFLFGITAAQGLLLYGCLLAGLQGTDGAMHFQIGAIMGIALAAVGIGSAISAISRSEMQAVLVVPLVLIPQILFSGHPVAAHEMKPAVYRVSQLLPTFAAQTLMDASFLWQKKLERDTLSDHWTSFRNLNRDGQLRTGEFFTHSEPAWRAVGTEALWGLATYLIAWRGLRRQERK